MLTARGLGVSAPGRGVLLRGVDLHVPEGGCLVLQGPSGTGKSLLCRALVDLWPLDAGVVHLRGVATRAIRPPELRSRMIYVPQTPPRTVGTVRDNLERTRDFAATRARARPWTEVLALADRLGIARVLDTPADRISGGEAQRMGLCRAAQLDPEVLLLDEPTAALDPATTTEVEAWLAEWRLAGPRGVVWVAHDRAQASRVGTSVVGVEAAP